VVVDGGIEGEKDAGGGDGMCFDGDIIEPDGTCGPELDAEFRVGFGGGMVPCIAGP
jgi:hypothetical protein